MNLRKLYNAIKTGDYQQTSEGVYYPAAKAMGEGIWTVQKNDETPEPYHNLVVTEGFNKMLGVMFDDGVSKISTWYIAVYEGVVTPLDSWTSGGGTPIGTRTTEVTAYDEATREEWIEDTAASGALTTTTNAVFTFNATKTITGSFLTSASAKDGSGDSSGTLFSCANFSASKSVVDDDTLTIGYTITLSNA